MIMVLAMTAALWIIGAVMSAPIKARLTMIAVLFAAVIALHLMLPDGHPLRRATGEDARLWLLLAAFAGIGWAYSKGLKRVRTMAQAKQAAAQPEGTFSDADLTRYARHITLREVGGPGQKALSQAKVLVIGAGGLGSPALLYLAGAGVGTIGVIDGDTVALSNLQRQVIHQDQSIGQPKVFSAQKAMEALNPSIMVKPYNRDLTADMAAELFADYDLVLDGTDSFATRDLVNRAAVTSGTPLISGAISQWEGQVSLFHLASDGPCYACVFPEAPASGLAPSCAEAGVIGPLPGIIGTLMALEAVKWITGAGDTLKGRMLVFDGLYGETRIVAIKRNPTCPVCG